MFDIESLVKRRKPSANKQYWKINKTITKRIIWFFLLSTILFLFLKPLYVGYPDMAKTSEILKQAAAVQTEINRLLKQSPEGPVQVNIDKYFPPTLSFGHTQSGADIQLDYKEIEPNGTIKLYSASLGVMVILTPGTVNTEIQWNCWGRPKKRFHALADHEQYSTQPVL